jgi:hypothetical protein
MSSHTLFPPQHDATQDSLSTLPLELIDPPHVAQPSAVAVASATRPGYVHKHVILMRSAAAPAAEGEGEEEEEEEEEEAEQDINEAVTYAVEVPLSASIRDVKLQLAVSDQTDRQTDRQTDT